MAWFERNHPDLYHSIELYKQLQALQLVWPLIESSQKTRVHAEAAKHFYSDGNPGDIHPQQVYDALLQEARAVVDRFSKTPDELKRLIDPQNLRKELKKYQEHVLDPVHFMWSKQDQIDRCSLFEKPNVEDLKGLEDVLTNSFLVAMDIAMRSPKERPHSGSASGHVSSL
jgi:hypothetical protein